MLDKYILYMCAGLKRRLDLFRSDNEIDTTVLNYFDEFEIHPDHIGVYAIMIYNAHFNYITLCVQILRRTVAVGWSKLWNRLRN